MGGPVIGDDGTVAVGRPSGTGRGRSPRGPTPRTARVGARDGRLPLATADEATATSDPAANGRSSGPGADGHGGAAVERIVGAVGGGLRVVLLVAALVVALLPIARAATSGFCPPETTEEGAAGTVVAAAPVGTPLAAGLDASTDEFADTTEEPAQDTGATEGDDGGEGGDSGDTGGSEGEEAVVDEGPCGPGVQECLPPLFSAVLEFGDEACGGEAVARLRSSMVPAFLVASGLLAGAWVLRPRDGAPIISRW